jgi:hypothetical protein
LFGFGVLSHVPQGNVDAFFLPTVTAITPEPSSKWLSLIAVLMLGLYRGRTSILDHFCRFDRPRMIR